EEIVKLKDMVKVLEDKEDVAVTQSGDDASIKGKSINEGEAAAERISNDSEEVEDFIPMGSKEETKRLKRKGLILEKEQVKKQKSSEEASKIETSTKEFTEEKIKEMMQLVPLEDVYVQPFKLNTPSLTGSIGPATSDKEMELWVELKRMYDLDPKDQLWTLTQNFMHAPVEWKLYDLSGVHHVTAKDKEIFMLVEKDYPLRRVKVVSTVRRLEMPLPEVCTAIEEKKKKLPVKERT
nr:hypothetical protein [Tanacetum cinerariifolium]